MGTKHQPGAARSAESDWMDERLEEEIERPALALLGHGSTIPGRRRPVGTDRACPGRGQPDSRGAAPHLLRRLAGRHAPHAAARWTPAAGHGHGRRVAARRRDQAPRRARVRRHPHDEGEPLPRGREPARDRLRLRGRRRARGARRAAHHVHTTGEVVRLLRGAGFRDVALLGADGTAPRTSSARPG